MKVDHLGQMIRGWFVGNFSPSVVQTDAFEVGVKHYKAGDYEATHHHKIATEITVIVSGEAEMAGRVVKPGDIVTLQPGEAADFKALTDVVCTVVKMPSVKGDKYEGR